MNKLELRKIIREEIQREVYNKRLESSVKEINKLLERALALNESIGKRNPTNGLMIENAILKAQKMQRLDEITWGGIKGFVRKLKNPAALLAGIGIPASMASAPGVSTMVQKIMNWASQAPPGVFNDFTASNGMVAGVGALTIAAITGLLMKAAKTDDEKQAVQDLKSDTEKAVKQMGAAMQNVDAGAGDDQGTPPAVK